MKSNLTILVSLLLAAVSAAPIPEADPHDMHYHIHATGNEESSTTMRKRDAEAAPHEGHVHVHLEEGGMDMRPAELQARDAMEDQHIHVHVEGEA